MAHHNRRKLLHEPPPPPLRGKQRPRRASICAPLTHACSPPPQIKVAFVSYATADTVPSPILVKRFFVDFKLVLRDMTQDISRLGLGSTNAGSMAALEGIVAALEVRAIALSLRSALTRTAL